MFESKLPHVRIAVMCDGLVFLCEKSTFKLVPQTFLFKVKHFM